MAAVALGINPLSAAELAKDEWSVLLVLKSQVGALEDSYNELGQLTNAAPGFDNNDRTELGQTWPGTYLSVIFYRPGWGTEDETYNADFHPIAPNMGDEWTFEVRSDDPTRDLSLTWVGKNTKMKNMELVDLQDNIVIPAVSKGKAAVYNFRMNGVVREFAWRVVPKKSSKETPQLLAADTISTNRAASRSVAPEQKSNWLPKGWGQGEGRGYRSDGAPDGLPADPFAGQ